MNKTVTINIAGLFFHIDEDAYNKLSNYLDSIKNSLNTEGKEEIINDIESRIAEIFTEKIDPKTGVISMTDVDNIIQIMGQPEDYILDDEDGKEYYSKETFENYAKRPRKLFRDGEKRVLGGVLSGLANYFNIDVVWIRILFIILFFVYGMSIIIYPILWIIIPKAKTVSDILEMKGEPVNISNIEKQVKENINHLGNNIKNIDTNKLKQAGTTAGEVIQKIIGITLIFFGSIFIIGSFIMLFALNTLTDADINGFPVQEVINLGLPEWSVILSIFTLAFIPALIIFIIGLRCFYKNMKYVSLISILLGFIWAIALIFFSVVMIKAETKNDALRKLIDDSSKVTVVKKSLNHITNDTLNIDFVRDPRFYGLNDTLSNEKVFIEQDEIEIEIRSTTNNDAYFEIVTEAEYSKSGSITLNNGNGNATFTEIPNMLEYYSKIDNNSIELANSLLVEKNKSNNYNNSVKIILYLPYNKSIRINSDSRSLFENDHQIKPGVNYYKVEANNLQCISCI